VRIGGLDILSGSSHCSGGSLVGAVYDGVGAGVKLSPRNMYHGRDDT
jgi:hypothetical protein